MFRVNVYVNPILNSQQEEEMQKKSLWKFGTREVVYSAIGAALYAVLAIATNWLQIPSAGNVSFRPAVAIPMFFGVAFGPIVGFIAGFLGNIISDLIAGYGFWFWWDLGNGLMGLVPGLIFLSLVNYKDVKTILKAELFVIIGVLVGMGVAAISEMWVSGADINTVIFGNFIPAVIPNLINGLILVPILMIAYAAIVQRSGR
jgi:energy-coupling factor transport system substrate-specific component